MTKKRIALILEVLLFTILVLLDQVTKYLAIRTLRGKPAKVLIHRVLELTYVENYGAAFGMLQHAKGLFLVITFFVLGAIVYTLYRMPEERRFRLLQVLLVILSAGACGNLIDRINSTFVVDFIYVSLIQFPVFNVADIYVTCSAIALFITMLTCYKEESFDFLKPVSREEGQS